MSIDFQLLEFILIVTTLLELNPLLQVKKIVKSKSSEDVSLATYAIILIIGILWLFYGITIGSLPLIVGNTIKAVASIAVIFTCLKYKNKP